MNVEMQKVWFFEKPTIGYCPDCDELAVWDSERGLHCPKCKSTEVSIFEWMGNGKYPES
ncbi:unnamed protein product [marine sediment metagenome]|uniref:Uncharacterized protein n=1 Tax=marine sediment metagenome TaxID=412755 RepID=X0ZWN0_9ZZZZ